MSVMEELLDFSSASREELQRVDCQHSRITKIKRSHPIIKLDLKPQECISCHGMMIVASMNFTARPFSSTRLPFNSHQTSPPRAESWRA